MSETPGDKYFREHERKQRLFLWLFGIAFASIGLLSLTGLGAVVYVAWHFIAKWW